MRTIRQCPKCGYLAPEGLKCPKDGAQLEELSASRDPLVGRELVERYVLQRHVAEGGMGKVYEAARIKDQVPVAVKILLEDFRHSAEHVARFTNEARLLQRIRHPNVVQILDAGQDEDVIFMVMERLRGRTLNEVIPEGGVEVDVAVSVMEEICAGVAAAHAVGLVHRDLKPENIFIAAGLDGTAVVKVIDFGLAKALKRKFPLEEDITGFNKVVGSAGYVAPEHIMGSREFSPASDVYALGALLFFLLTGTNPFGNGKSTVIMQRQVSQQTSPLALPKGHAGANLERVIRRAMSAPADRYPTAQALGDAVRRAIAKNRGVQSRVSHSTFNVANTTITHHSRLQGSGSVRLIAMVAVMSMVVGAAVAVAIMKALGVF